MFKAQKTFHGDFKIGFDRASLNHQLELPLPMRVSSMFMFVSGPSGQQDRSGLGVLLDWLLRQHALAGRQALRGPGLRRNAGLARQVHHLHAHRQIRR